MIIRNANIIDIENISNLYITNWKNTYSELLPQDFLDSLTVNSAICKWSNYLNSENNKLFVAYEKDEFLGFVSSKVDDEDAHWWYLDSLHVNKDARGHGVGTKLIYEVGKYALTNNYKSMSICIVCGNDNAGNLYKKLGATHYKYFVDDFGGTKSNSQKLVWRDLSIFK